MDLERFAFSTSAYSRQPLSKALKQIARTGFKGAELVADKPHVWLDNFSAKNVSALQKDLEKLGLFVSNVNANTSAGFWTDAPPGRIFEPSLISAAREQREWRVAYVKKALRLGQQLATHSVSITSGKCIEIPPEKARKLLYENLSRLVETAESYGIRLSLEFEPGLLVESSEEVLALLKQIGSSCFGACLNVANTGSSPEAIRAIRMLKGRIFNLQLADVAGGKSFTRAPGEGELDFRAVFKELNAVRYNGPLTWNLPDCSENADQVCQKTYRYIKGIATPKISLPPKRKAAAS